MRAIVPPMNMIRRRKGRIGECAARDDDSAGKICSGFRKSAPTTDRAKSLHHIRCGFASRKPYGVFSRDDPDIFLKESHIVRKCAARCTLTTRASAYVVVQRIAIDLEGKSATSTLRMMGGHRGQFLVYQRLSILRRRKRQGLSYPFGSTPSVTIQP